MRGTRKEIRRDLQALGKFQDGLAGFQRFVSHERPKPVEVCDVGHDAFSAVGLYDGVFSDLGPVGKALFEMVVSPGVVGELVGSVRLERAGGREGDHSTSSSGLPQLRRFAFRSLFSRSHARPCSRREAVPEPKLSLREPNRRGLCRSEHHVSRLDRGRENGGALESLLWTRGHLGYLGVEAGGICRVLHHVSIPIFAVPEERACERILNSFSFASIPSLGSSNL